MLTEEPRRRFSITDPTLAEGASLKTSIVMELCDKGSLLQMREKIWAMMKQVGQNRSCKHALCDRLIWTAGCHYKPFRPPDQ